MTVAAEIRAALHAGRAAAETRQPPGDNPYAAGQTPRERVLAVMWRNGYASGNPFLNVELTNKQFDDAT